ncbi:putative tRNA sulfurtransferase [Nitrospira sp.]|nr:putative tRNA sulfurtransferase [Nitrospira sp.]
MRCIIVHYHELALKGRNRPLFEKRLVEHLRWVLTDLKIRQVQALNGRIRIELTDATPWPQAKERVARVVGCTHFVLAESVPMDVARPDMTPMKTAAARLVEGRNFDTFRVNAKRADKRFPWTSVEIERQIGAHLCELTGKRVSLKTPTLTVHVELVPREAFVAVERVPGPGGLPLGVSGTVACLLSGGIDSPVAAYRMMKRGCRAVFIHFHGRPYVSRASEEKVRELAQLLTSYQLDSRLYLISFGDIQRQIVLGAPTALRVVLYRRMMLRIAEELAHRERCWALVTGDSLGQVASQTPENLSVVQEATSLPVLRPLIGMDKIEITYEAKRLGSFETSIEPDQDCCSLFVPPHPSTKTSLDQIRKVERGLDIGALTKQGLDGAMLTELTFPKSRTV